MTYAVVLSEMPPKITVGESMSWTWNDSRFPATSWTLVYTLVSPSAQEQITASANGSAFKVEVTTSTTAAYVAGDYTWQAHVLKDSERYKVAAGLLTVEADLATKTNGLDTRSHAKKVLDALTASIENRASKTQIEQAINGVQIQHMTLAEQVEMRDRYAIKYHKEQSIKAGRSPRRTVKARFTN